MHLANDGLELWYGTSDAPAPDGTTVGREGVSVTVGVKPSNPANAVKVRYRVDGRRLETLSAQLMSTNHQAGTQYFKAVFPTFWTADTVEYLPIVTSGGRRAPDPAAATKFPSNFRLQTLSMKSPTPERIVEPRPMFQPTLEHLVHVEAPLAKQPELIGQTPAGYVVNWPPVGGTLIGKAFQATVIPGGEHETTVRADGVGILSVRVSVKTLDNALISLRYSGTVDYGTNWAEWLQTGNWPETLPVRSEIRMLTSAPKYQWLNRLQCIGVGLVYPPQAFYRYDIYAVR